MEEGSEPSIRSAPADMRAAAMEVPSAPSGDGDAGLRYREPSPPSLEGQEAAMYERIADYIGEVRTSLRIDVTDAVYSRCMEELRSVRAERFDRVSQSLENLRALVDQFQSRLVLVEDSRLENPATYGEGRPERPTSSARPDASSAPLGGATRCLRAPDR